MYINNWGVPLDDQVFLSFNNGRIDCKDAFHAVNTALRAENELIQSILANRFSTNYLLDVRQEIFMMISQKKQASKCKKKLIILQSIGIIVIKVRKQRWSPTPADILVGL